MITVVVAPTKAVILSILRDQSQLKDATATARYGFHAEFSGETLEE